MSALFLCFHAASATWGHPVSIPPHQLLALVRAMSRVRPVHVTFDDAYRNIDNVLPDLLALGVPVTVFVCSGFADRGGAPLKVPELVREDDAELATMDWEALRSWLERGVEVGSHTVDHPHLRELSDAELDRQFRESKERVETELSRPCPWLAYPYGEHDARVRAAARGAGYERAFALRGLRGDPYAMSRIDLNRRDSLPRALLKASPLYEPLGKLHERVRAPVRDRAARAS